MQAHRGQRYASPSKRCARDRDRTVESEVGLDCVLRRGRDEGLDRRTDQLGGGLAHSCRRKRCRAALEPDPEPEPSSAALVPISTSGSRNTLAISLFETRSIGEAVVAVCGPPDATPAHPAALGRSGGHTPS